MSMYTNNRVLWPFVGAVYNVSSIIGCDLLQRGLSVCMITIQFDTGLGHDQPRVAILAYTDSHIIMDAVAWETQGV